jgi:hypothetical protein
MTGQFLPIWEVTGRADVTLMGATHSLGGKEGSGATTAYNLVEGVREAGPGIFCSPRH